MLDIAKYYIIIISAISIVACIYDKIASKVFTKHRVPEATLFFFSAIGGSLAMYIAMQIFHHKTKHKSFMIGIPVIMLVQAIGIILYFYFTR